MKSSFLLLILCLVSFSGLTQKKKPAVAKGLSVPVVIHWAKGETTYLKLSRTEENVSSNEYYKLKTDYDVRLKVLEKTDTSYTLEWTYTTANSVVEDYQLRGAVLRLADEGKLRDVVHKMLKTSEESAKGMKVIYTTNEFGEFKEIVNREELRDQYRKSFKGMLSVLTAELPAEKRDSTEKVFSFIADMIASDSDFGLTFDDIQLLHKPFGYEYEPGTLQSLVGVMKSPFNDDEYAIDMDVKMSKYSSEKKTCTIEGSSHINEEVMKEYITDFIKTLQEQGMTQDNSLNQQDLEMEMDSNFSIDIDLNYGWPYQINETSKTKKNHDISTSTIQITLRL